VPKTDLVIIQLENQIFNYKIYFIKVKLFIHLSAAILRGKWVIKALPRDFSFNSSWIFDFTRQIPP